MRFLTLVSTVALALASVWGAGQVNSKTAEIVLMPLADAQIVFEAAPDSVPDVLRGLVGNDLATAWAQWAAQRNREIRARLERGDEDTVVNLLLFGTSFTREPRLTFSLLSRAKEASGGKVDPSSPLLGAVRRRADDLVRVAAVAGQNERLEFARHVLERNGFGFASEEARSKAAGHLLQHFAEMLQENDRYAELLKAVQLQNDRRQELETRSTLFKTRGISLDTSWQPNLAIEQALAALKGKGLFTAGSVHRVAVIGPGLDFTDKEEGYDFYPPQTIQPFAVFDSLVRLGLSSPDSLEITTLDLSERVNDHVNRARERAAAGAGYTVELTLNPAIHWRPDALAYWNDWGSRIGASVAPIRPPVEMGRIETRAVKVQPAVVLRVAPRDVNVVMERLRFDDPGERFDLVIATNVLVYYDLFEQALALQNIAAMVRPGGFLLSNDALIEVRGGGLRSAGSSVVSYSDRKEDADYVKWYQNSPPKQ
jgi:SAM-dependent methyltransferase